MGGIVLKFKLLRDILIYIIAPVLLFNSNFINNTEIAFQVSCSLAIIYSIFTKIKEDRVNTTGFLIFSIVIIYFLSHNNPNSHDIYFYKTCIFLSIAFIIPGLRLFNKDLSTIVIRDTLRALNKNSLAMIRLLKKKSMMNEINKISSMVEANFILVSLLRIINILVYGGESNSSLNFVANCIGIIFTVAIICRIVKVIYTSKKLNINKTSKGPDNGNHTKGKVINFNYFK